MHAMNMVYPSSVQRLIVKPAEKGQIMDPKNTLTEYQKDILIKALGEAMDDKTPVRITCAKKDLDHMVGLGYLVIESEPIPSMDEYDVYVTTKAFQDNNEGMFKE